MKTFIQLSKVLLLSIALINFGCSKEEDETITETPTTPTQPPAASFTLNKSSLKQLEFGQITVANVNLAAESYAGNVGNSSVNLTNVDGDLFFMAPDISAGNYKLTADIEGNPVELTFDITATPTVASPEVFIDNIQQDIFDFDDLDSTISAINNLNSNLDLQDHKQALQEIQADYNNIYSQLDAAQKAEVAKFLKANEDLFTDVGSVVKIDSLNFNKAGLGEYDVYLDALSRDMMKKAVKIAALTAAGVSSLTACAASAGFFVPACLASLVSGGAAIKYSVELLEDYERSLDKTILLYEMDIEGINEKSFEFTHDQTFQFNIRGHRRSIYKDDVGSTVPILSYFIEVGNKGQEYYNAVVDLINDLAAQFTKGYGVLNRFPHPSGVDNFKSQWFPEKGTYYSVGNISNAKVTIKNQNVVNNTLEVTFENSDTTDQNFSFELIYDDGDFRTTERFSASIEGQAANGLSILGLWNLVKENDGNTTTNVGEWKLDGFAHSTSGPCAGIKAYPYRSKVNYERLNFNDNQGMNYSQSSTDEDRTYSMDQNCNITYGPWTNTTTETDSELYNYQIVNQNTLIVSVTDGGVVYQDTLQYTLSPNELIVSNPIDNWTSYYSR
ncbi:MAG: hypothetical protein RIC95_11655 [Vicingaceae bacterium]